jgi:predicted P-loop ATPase
MPAGEATSSRLTPEHVAELVERSAISLDVAHRAGLWSESDPKRLHHMTGRAKQAWTPEHVPALVFPYYLPEDPDPAFYNVKPAIEMRTPKEDGTVESSKYISTRLRKNESKRLYFTPSTLANEKDRQDPNRALFIIEGEKKALCADSVGFFAVWISGCNAWSKKKTGRARRELHDDFKHFALKGRHVYIGLDGDRVIALLSIRREEVLLCEALAAAGAVPHVLRFPDGADGKVGFDDFVVANGRAAVLELCSAAKPKIAAVTDGSAQPWQAMLRRTDRGPAASLANLLCIFEHDERWKGAIGYDERFNEVVFMRAPPASVGGTFPREIRDADETEISRWLETETGAEFAITKVHGAIEAVAHRNAFDRVREYLEGLRWDGESRIDTWLRDFLGAEDTPLHRAFAAKWLISAVARALTPGCKVDHMLVLEAPQGARKSSALLALVPDPRWFCDSLPDLRDQKAAAETIQGPWIFEMGELDAISKAEATTIKQWLTKQSDRFRPAYGRRTVDRARRCVFAGSTNEHTYLKDATGGRRFWPVQVGQGFDTRAIAAARDQLWAEAVERFRVGATWYLDAGDMVADAARAQEERYQGDEWETVLTEYLRERELAGGSLVRVTVGDCLSKLGLGVKDWTPPSERRVGQALRRLGWHRRQRTDGTSGSVRWAYEPPGSSNAKRPPGRAPGEFDDGDPVRSGFSVSGEQTAFKTEAVTTQPNGTFATSPPHPLTTSINHNQYSSEEHAHESAHTHVRALTGNGGFPVNPVSDKEGDRF